MTNGQRQFDAFFAHNSVDRDLVRQVKRNLEQLARDTNINLRIWLDEDQIVAGFLLSQIQTGISQCRYAVFFIGLNGSGQWQGNLELPVIVNLAIQSRITLIPVLLPGVENMPDDNNYLFLDAHYWIAFSRTDDSQSLSKLLHCIMDNSQSNTIASQSLENDSAFVDNNALLTRLQRLIPSQFDEVQARLIFRFSLNFAHLPQGGTQSEKATALIRLAEINLQHIQFLDSLVRNTVN